MTHPRVFWNNPGEEVVEASGAIQGYFLHVHLKEVSANYFSEKGTTGQKSLETSELKPSEHIISSCVHNHE